jgi:hypothetical protein
MYVHTHCTHVHGHTHTHTASHLVTLQVFPELYLPVMEEANRRVLMPIRMYLPLLPAWWKFRSRMSKLNTYLINYVR